MMGVAKGGGDQVIAMSSNDWDYTFAQSEWPAAGNALGDHTLGGFIDPTGGDSALYSLITFDGDCIVSFIAAGINDNNNGAWGFMAIDEDDTRSASDTGNMKNMTNSFWYDEASASGKDFYIGGSAESDAETFAEGVEVRWERVAGTIKVYKDDALVHTFSSTYSGTIRWCFAAHGSPFEQNYDNIFFTDTDKIQRDGFLYGVDVSGQGVGDGWANGRNVGALIPCTRSGEVQTIQFISDNITANWTGHIEVWTSDGTSPVAQIGGDSAGATISTTGLQSISWASDFPPVTKGASYWYIFVDTGGSGRIAIDDMNPLAGMAQGTNDTLTSMAVGDEARTMRLDVEIDTSAGEPTPDHDTLLLIHSDTTDASTTFVDSSQTGRTITVADNAQHDTAQKKFGASAILFDGTGDYLTYPDSPDWKPAAITIDLWIRLDTNGISQPIMGQWGGGASSAHAWYLHIGGGNTIEWTVSNGSSSVTSSSTTAMSTGTWYHIAAVYNSNGGGSGIWVNGTSEATNSSLVTIQDYAEVVRIGTDFASRYFDGWMDEIRISKTARWEPGVAFTPPSAPYS